MCDKNDFPIFMAITIVCATVSLAELASANIVGYTTSTIQGTDEAGAVKWHLLAIQFKDVTGSDDSIALKDALQMTSVPAYAGTWKTRQANAPTLQIWDGSGFVSYWYVAPECSGLAENAWVQNTKADVGATVKLKAGDAIWFTAKNLGTGTGAITFSGSVKTESSSTVAVGAGAWNMGSNPYPTTYSINNIIPSFDAYAGTWKTRQANAPTLQIWDGSGFVSYYYVAPACSGLAENAWVQNSKAATTATLAPGAGFWFKNVDGKEGTLTFNFSN